MAPRPNWKGYLKLSLVSCSVALYSATSTSDRIRFNIINKKTGNRVRNLVIDSETEEPVEQEDRIKGFQVEKGQYVLLEDEELDEVALESTHTIDIEGFVPRSEVRFAYFSTETSPGGLVYEMADCMEPHIYPVIQMIAEAARDWDGKDPIREIAL